MKLMLLLEDFIMGFRLGFDILPVLGLDILTNFRLDSLHIFGFNPASLLFLQLFSREKLCTHQVFGLERDPEQIFLRIEKHLLFNRLEEPLLTDNKQAFDLRSFSDYS